VSRAADIDLAGLDEALQSGRVAFEALDDHPVTAELVHEVTRQVRAAMASPDAQTAPAARSDRKAWVTAQARATLAGFHASLIDTDDGRPQLVCSRWHLTRAFDNLPELETWLHRVTGKSA